MEFSQREKKVVACAYHHFFGDHGYVDRLISGISGGSIYLYSFLTTETGLLRYAFSYL